MDADGKLIRRLAEAATMPDELLFMPLAGENAGYRKRFKKVAGAQIR